jgi:hypothetical protein
MPTSSDPEEIKYVQAKLYWACAYLRKTHGRTETEAPRRILTAAAKLVGTDKEIDLTRRNIKARLK